MLINLSNHPSTQWLNEQLVEGRKYGNILDVEFPVVDPKGNDESIKQLAQECTDNVKNILFQSKDTENAVHVMGEPTLVYHIVTLLKQQGITCLASTTSRESIEENGLKTSKFTFTQFREY